MPEWQKNYILLDSDKHLPLYRSYILDEHILERESQDCIINTREKQIISLCVSSCLRILNGRTLGDSMGSYTSFQPSGSSVIDYFIASH